MKTIKKSANHVAATPILLDGHDLAPVGGGMVLAPGQEPRRLTKGCDPDSPLLANVVMA
jgi:hypothetical protein